MLDRARTQRRRLTGAPFALVGGVDEPGVPPITRAELRRARVLADRAEDGRFVLRLNAIKRIKRHSRRTARLISCKHKGALN